LSGPVQATEVEIEEINWLWPIKAGEGEGRIARGNLTVIAGRPDHGKGLTVVRIGADVSNAGGNVLHSAIEDSPGLMTRPRYEAAGADLKRVHLWRFLMPAQLRELQAVVVKKEIDLVIIDPVAAHLTGGISRHSDSIRMVLNPLQELAEMTDCAIVFIDHALKRVQATGHPLDCIGGSGSGLPAACRSAFVFGSTPEDDDGRYLCTVKMNLREWSKTEAIRFEMDTVKLDVGDKQVVAPFLELDDLDCDIDPMRLFEKRTVNGKVGRPPDKLAAACEWLTTYLIAQGEPTPAGTVMEDAKQYRMSAKTLRRAATDMGVVKNPPGGGAGCTWWLPDEVLEAMGWTDGGDDKPASTVDTSADEYSSLDAEIAEFLGEVDLPDLGGGDDE
jgi:hypothetical protein